MEQKKKEMGTVFSQKEIAPDIFDMWIETSLAAQAKPGQFIAVYPKAESTLLPRPISICEIDKANGMLMDVSDIYKSKEKEQGKKADTEPTEEKCECKCKKGGKK